MDKKLTVMVCLLLVCSVVLTTAPAWAKKPDKPPDQGADPTGTIFFNYNGDIWTMDADGSGRTKQIAWSESYKTLSWEKHGGHYWYLGYCDIEGETYPDGVQRREIFAFRDDATKTVQLTNDASLASSKYSGTPAWAFGDDFISWSAKQWEADTGSGQYVSKYGIYKAPIAVDSNGDLTGLGDEPELVYDTGSWQCPSDGLYYPDSRVHRWAPDNTRLVHMRAGHELYVVDTGTGSESYLTTGYTPGWSPEGSKILFTLKDDLRIINPDGTGEKVLVATRDTGGWYDDVKGPAWSPDGNYIVYTDFQWARHDFTVQKTDIYIIEIDGSDKTCLTRNLPQGTHKQSRDWR